MRFCFICIFFVTYFIIDFVYQRGKILATVSNYQTLKMISDRSFLLKYVILYTYEDILFKQPVMVSGQNFEGEYNARQTFIDNVYINENNIDQKQSEEPQKDLTEYNDLFIILNLGQDFCANFYGGIEYNLDF